MVINKLKLLIQFLRLLSSCNPQDLMNINTAEKENNDTLSFDVKFSLYVFPCFYFVSHCYVETIIVSLLFQSSSLNLNMVLEFKEKHLNSSNHAVIHRSFACDSLAFLCNDESDLST